MNWKIICDQNENFFYQKLMKKMAEAAVSKWDDNCQKEDTNEQRK